MRLDEHMDHFVVRPKTFDGKRDVNVLVTGSARSGTTLTHMLVGFGFYDTCLVWPETHTSTENVHVDTDRKWVVWKSHLECRRLKMVALKMESVPFVVYVVRDPRDIVTSRNKSHTWKYVVSVAEVVESYKKLLDDTFDGPDFAGKLVRVRYEDLVARPDDVQREIAGAIGMDIRRPFSECHNHFFEIQDERFVMRDSTAKKCYADNLKSVYQGPHVRPIDSSSVGKWRVPEHRERIVELLGKVESRRQLVGTLIDLGYEKDDSWVSEFLNA